MGINEKLDAAVAKLDAMIGKDERIAKAVAFVEGASQLHINRDNFWKDVRSKFGLSAREAITVSERAGFGVAFMPEHVRKNLL